MHRKGIFHRNIKPENILLTGDLVKLADLGSCHGTQGEHPFTEYISTRWYRSPECLMTDGYYDQKMDIWGAGCVMFEILTLVPLFPGKNELDMIHKIHSVLGTPSQHVLDRFKKHASHLDFNFPQKAGSGLEKLLSHVSPDCLDLLKQLLIYDPEKRITSEQVLQHEYFRDMVEMEKQREFQSTLSSTRPSPTFTHLNNSLTQDQEKRTTFHHDKIPQQQANPKKMKNGHVTASKFPSMNVNVKVEGIFKQSHYNDISTEEENHHGGMLPPLKGKASNIHMETKLSFNTMHHPIIPKKKEDFKKLNTIAIKPSISNQYLYKKKNPYMQQPDQLVMGKKIF